MKTIKLHGELADKFGMWHELDVVSAAEAVRALSVNHPGFEQHLYQSEERKVRYHVLADDHVIEESELLHPVHQYIHFIPVVVGAGSGRGNLIVGAALIVAGTALTVFTGGTAASIGVSLIKVGASLAISGIVQSLTPVPKAPEPPEQADNKPSYTFNGPVNTSAQGQPVAVGYGRLIVGSAVVSASISVDDLSPPPVDYSNLFPGGVLYK